MNIIDLDSESRFEPQLKQGSIKKVLMIEDNIDDANIMQEMLTDAIESSFKLIRADCLERGLDKLLAGDIDIVLLDLCLPDSQVQDTFSRLYERTPDVPIIVLASPGEESLAVRAAQLGAKDYIIKGKTDSLQLRQLINYAVEQHEIQHELSNLALIDKPTDLYSHQSFLVLGQHYLKLANRAKKGLIFFYIDIENLRDITKKLGNQGKNKALVDSANILKQTFRRSDVLARFANNEFAILALEAHKDSDKVIMHRLQKNLGAYNSKAGNPVKISLSVGAVFYDPNSPSSIAELMARVRKSKCHRVIEKT